MKYHAGKAKLGSFVGMHKGKYATFVENTSDTDKKKDRIFIIHDNI